MTREEKFKGITERLKDKAVDFDPMHISAMVIVSYLDQLQSHGIIESAFTINPSGKAVAAICEEFDWQPDDEDIKAFVLDMIEAPERPAFMYMIRRFRDEPEKFLAEFEDFKKKNSPGT